MQAAEELGLEDVMVEVFEDPTFIQRMQYVAQQGPKDSGKGSLTNPKAIMQQGGFPMMRNVMSPMQQQNQFAQATAAEGQAAFGGMGGY